MQLYIVTHISELKKHLEEALSMHAPIHVSTLLSDPNPKTILFLHDGLLENLSESELKALFNLHAMVLSITPSFERHDIISH